MVGLPGARGKICDRKATVGGLPAGGVRLCLSSMRERFISLAMEGCLPFAQVCARFGISRKTGYKWLNRFRAEGAAGLLERDRVPRSHPRRTPPEIEALVAELASRHPEWSVARLRAELEIRELEPVPAPTTLEAILRRRAGHDPSSGSRRAAPNDVWEMWIGPVTVSAGLNHRAYVLRDRATGFVLAADVKAERGEEGCTELLWAVFGQQGLPRRLLWPVEASLGGGHTPLSVAVLRLGVAFEWVGASGVGRMAGAGTDLLVRLRGTVEGGDVVERLTQRGGSTVAPLTRSPHETLARWRGRLAAWRDEVNLPAAARGSTGSGPALRYRPSPRSLTEATTTAASTATEEELRRRVSEKGVFMFRGSRWSVGRAFAGEVVELRALPGGAGFGVFFANQPIGLVTERAEAAEEPALRRVAALGEEWVGNR